MSAQFTIDAKGNVKYNTTPTAKSTTKGAEKKDVVRFDYMVTGELLLDGKVVARTTTKQRGMDAAEAIRNFGVHAGRVGLESRALKVVLKPEEKEEGGKKDAAKPKTPAVAKPKAGATVVKPMVPVTPPAAPAPAAPTQA